MDFIFLNSCFYSKRKDRIQTIRPHLRIGVASICGYLREKGARVSILDIHADGIHLNKLVSKIISLNPIYLCLSAYTEEINDASCIAEEVKKQNPKIKMIVGGCHVSALPIETLQEFPAFDIGVIGEGEQTMVDIYKGKNLNAVTGIARRDTCGKPVLNEIRNERMDFYKLPFPVWDLYDLKKYGNMLPIEPLRACPYNCIFCFRATGKKVIYKSPQNFVNELEFYINRYDIHHFRFLAGTFPLKKKHAMDICEQIISKKLKIKWEASTRVDLVDYDLLRLMKEAGCDTLQFGIESGSPEILNNCKKAIDPGRSIETVRLCKKIGIKAGINFIIGLPLETSASIRSTLRLTLKMRKYTDNANCAILVPFPGTKIYEMALNKKSGIALNRIHWSRFGKQAGHALQHSNFTRHQLQRYQSLFYILYYVGAPLKTIRLFSFYRLFMVIKRLFNINIFN